MKNNLLINTLKIALLLTIFEANSQENIVKEGYYLCETESAYTTSDLNYTDIELINTSKKQGYNSSLKEIKNRQKIVSEGLSEQNIGKEFIVDIKNGKVSGFFDNTIHSEPLVLSYGSDTGSYQSLSYSYNVYYLKVEQYSANKRKPFIYSTNSVVMMGFCELK